MTRTPAIIAALLTALLAPAAAAQDTAWPEYETSLVERLDPAPWDLQWAPAGGLGAPTDLADAATLAQNLGLEPGDIRLEGRGSVVVRTPAGEWPVSARSAGRPDAIYKHLAAYRDGGEHLAERTWLALYEPDHPREDPGLVVLLPGMFGTPQPVIDALVGALRQRGWHVLRMLSHPARYTQRAAYTLDPDADPAPLAAEIAEDLGLRTARCALVVEEVCAHLADERPELPVRRRVGIGLSGGGMALPTVVARDRDAYAAAVFVGAGCDFAAIALDSNYADWIDAVRIRWTRPPTPDEAARFTEAYLAAAPFDGHATAPALAGLPTLMLHGSLDQAVPARQGDLLWERLGRPERWSATLGHETLFLLYLPSRVPDLLDWLDAAVAPERPAAPRERDAPGGR